MLDDIVQTLTEMIHGESTLEMGFWKFFITFVIIFVFIKWLTDDGKDK